MVPATITFTDLVSNYNLFYDSNIISIAPSPTTQARYTINLSQSGLDLFSGAAQKKDGKVSFNKTKLYLFEFKWDATGKWSLANDKSGLFLNPPDGLKKLNASPNPKPNRTPPLRPYRSPQGVPIFWRYQRGTVV